MGSRHRPSSIQSRSVRARIERWRATRAKRSPMPEPLWDAAVELAQAEVAGQGLAGAIGEPERLGRAGDPGAHDEELVAADAARRRLQRLLELLDQAPDILAAGRKRYTHYKQRGYPLRHHDID